MCFFYRILGASVKSKEISVELLIVLGSRDKQWSVLEDVSVKNQQNGLVSFELTENFDRFAASWLCSSKFVIHVNLNGR